MPGRTYSATGTEPSSLIIPWGGINGYSGGELLTNCADNFTIELWVKTGGETHEIDQLYATGGGTSGQRYVIDPPQGLYYNNSYDDAGVGISVGTNGVSIYEHNYGYMPAVLVWEGTITDWTHIALVYENKIPMLYINGNLVGTGTASPKTHVYPGTLLGSGVFGTMNGWIDEARIWNTVRSHQQIQDNMHKSVATPQSNLEAYWPIQTGETTNLQDISGNNHTVVLPPGNNYGSYTNDGGSTAPLSGDYYYRYGFNEQENDNEVKGNGNQLDYGARIYDPRLGRFLSVDPLQLKFPGQTPYIFSNNDPIANIDVGGKYALFIHYMLTKYMLKQAGVSDVKAQLIAHYASVFADNPAGISSTKEASSMKDYAIIVTNILGAAHSDNAIFGEMGGRISDKEATDNMMYKKGIDYSKTKDSQGENADAQKWHATRTYSERNTVTKEAAVQRSLVFAWEALFRSANEGGFEQMEANTSSIQDFAQALHTIQDIYAHDGAVFRATKKNLFGYRSTNGNDHNIDNDSHPNQDQFLNAKFMTQNAIKVYRILSGDISNIKFDNGTVTTRGMSAGQVETLIDKIKSAGYTVEADGKHGYKYHK